MITDVPYCYRCRYRMSNEVCSKYPSGIPSSILIGTKDCPKISKKTLERDLARRIEYGLRKV